MDTRLSENRKIRSIQAAEYIKNYYYNWGMTHHAKEATHHVLLGLMRKVD
jgi:hypothetical protein